MRATIRAAFEGDETIPAGVEFEDLINTTIDAMTIAEDMDITSDDGQREV